VADTKCDITVTTAANENRSTINLATELQILWQTVNINSMTNTNFFEYGIKTPDDGQ
jgi:hypothetical protein